jgi:hypothetical protein
MTGSGERKGDGGSGRRRGEGKAWIGQGHPLVSMSLDMEGRRLVNVEYHVPY